MTIIPSVMHAMMMNTMTQAAVADLYLPLASSSDTTVLGMTRSMMVGGGGARGSVVMNTKAASLMQEVVSVRLVISRFTGAGKSRTREA